MCDRLLKYYQRDSQADADTLEMERGGWRKIGIRYSHAARMWEVEYERPVSMTRLAEQSLGLPAAQLVAA